MQSLIQRLFVAAHIEPKDGLTQPQRETTLDLLLLAMYADNRIALKEDEAIDAEVATLSWESGLAPEYYINTATACVRKVLDNATAKAALIEDIGQRLATVAQRQSALALCDQLLKSDATTTDAENNFEAEVKRIFGL
jgi:hypothetical protein